MNKQPIHTLIILLAILFILPYSASAQKIDVSVNGQRMLQTISYMASNQFLGRKPNTPEFYELQDWVIEQYEECGVEPAGENGTFFQAVPINREYAVTYGMPKLLINGREFFSYYEDFSIDSRSVTGKKIKGEIVFVGYGISAPEKGLDEYANVDVNGKLVFILKGSPNTFKPPRNRFAMMEGREENQEPVRENWSTETKDSTKIITAYEKGAAGILFFNPEPESDQFMRRFRRQVEASYFERDFIIVSDVSEQVMQWILWTDPQMSSRGFTSWMNSVRGDIKKKMSRSFNTKLTAEVTGFNKTYLKGEKFGDDKGRNIIAKITGTDPSLKNEYVVIGAHFDHLGVTNGQIYNGAEDNATGSAVVMELARIMKEQNIKNKRTVILCLWTAEELGLIGSRHWVANPTDGVIMDSVVAYFNLDMVGRGDEIGAPGALNFPSIWEVIKRDQEQDIIDALKPREGGPGGSDHSAFIELGIEALALMTGGDDGHPDYHDTGDDVEKLNPEILRKTCSFVLQGAVNLANEMTTKLLIPDREDIFNGMYWPLVVIDPELEVKNGWTWLDLSSERDLSKDIIKKIKELKMPEENLDPFERMRRRFRFRALQSGIKGADVFNNDVHLLEIAREALGFGRLDILGDDGVWFDQGLTKQGAVALSTMRKKSIALHLVAPSKATLVDVLDKSKKPFLVSDFSELDDSLIVDMNEKKVLFGVDFYPEDVDRCVTLLENLRNKFGDTDNLLLNVKDATGFEKAKRILYQRLIEKGWTKDEIYAIGGTGVTRRSQGNLNVLPGGQPQFPMRM